MANWANKSLWRRQQKQLEISNLKPNDNGQRAGKNRDNESRRHRPSQLIMESLLSLRRRVLDAGSQSQAGEHGM